MCRWMVYSRATTSEIAERCFFAPVFFGWVFGLSLAISTVVSEEMTENMIECRSLMKEMCRFGREESVGENLAGG